MTAPAYDPDPHDHPHHDPEGLTMTTTDTDTTTTGDPIAPTVTTTPGGRILPPPPEHDDGPRPGKPRTAGLFPRLRRSRADDLSDAEAEALARRVSDDPVRLDPAALACADCGRAVPGPLDPGAIQYAEPDGVEREGGHVSTAPGYLTPEPLTTCPACAERHALAARLAADYLPTLTVGGLTHHGDGVAHAIRSALTVLAVLDRPMPDPDAGTLTPDTLARAVRRLAGPGAGLAWRSRYAPIRQADAIPDTAAPRPWAHVRETTRAGLRRAYADLMAERLALSAPPVALAPPALTRDDLGTSGTSGAALPVPGGCLVCGVATVSLPAAAVVRHGGREDAAAHVWTVRRIAPDALGARRSPVRLAGHLCPACEAAVTAEGALGPSALERALCEFLGVSRYAGPEPVRLERLKGWGGHYADTLRAGATAPPPNREPWDHVNTSGLADELRADGSTAHGSTAHDAGEVAP